MHKEYKRFITEHYFNASHNTITQFNSTLRKLPPPDELTRENILEVIMVFDNPTTKFNHFCRIKVVLKYLGKSELLDGITFKRPKTSVKRSDLLTTVEIAALLRASDSLFYKALIEFLLESGCRIGEALNLEVEDIAIDNNFIVANVDGKTGPRQIPLRKDTLHSFLMHLTTLDTGRIFGVIYKTSLKNITKIFAKADVRKRDKTIHCFRHTKCTQLVKEGYPEHLIRKFMGWSPNSNMVNNYTHLNTRDLQDFIARKHGFDIAPVEPLYPEEEKQRLKEILG